MICFSLSQTFTSGKGFTPIFTEYLPEATSFAGKVPAIDIRFAGSAGSRGYFRQISCKTRCQTFVGS